MNEIIKQEIKELFYKNKGYATTKEISNKGINRYYVSTLEKSGFILKIKTGLYKWVDYDFQYNFELVDVFKIVPKGILCLTSALAYHDLTTINPWQYEIAIERSSKVIIPEYPPIKILYFSQKQLNIGITNIEVDGHLIKIYDIEKTICDCIRYRNKIGIDIVKEAINEYIKRKDRNFNKLMKYAEVCRVKKILKQYLEVLV
ncbi:MAG: type IV toxin-antitoxin system AbiEi family antitoxin domain-containing protein [Clostridium sp.]|uniref:type IV toxin-antitoxin system AbiEi family antitoxin domain-containing protein n=1 Tax=Clostridium sp. TaxID=1506 RepID=UPI003D6CABCB